MSVPVPWRPAIHRGRALLASGLLLLAGCGGGEGSGPPPTVGTEGPNSGVGRAWISSPSQTGTYQTDRTTVRLQGGSFTPAGATCPGWVGVLPPGYSVMLSNDANGRSWPASASLNCVTIILTTWDAGLVPLEVGANTLHVTADDSAGNVGRDRIVVTRVPDTTPPTVVQASPGNGWTGVSRNATPYVQFSEAMDSTTLNATTLTLTDDTGAPVPSGVTYDPSLLMATLTPNSTLAPTTTYRVTVTTGVRDYPGGNPLKDPFVFAFTTGL